MRSKKYDQDWAKYKNATFALMELNNTYADLFELSRS